MASTSATPGLESALTLAQRSYEFHITVLEALDRKAVGLTAYLTIAAGVVGAAGLQRAANPSDVWFLLAPLCLFLLSAAAALVAQLPRTVAGLPDMRAAVEVVVEDGWDQAIVLLVDSFQTSIERVISATRRKAGLVLLAGWLAFGGTVALAVVLGLVAAGRL